MRRPTERTARELGPRDDASKHRDGSPTATTVRAPEIQRRGRNSAPPTVAVVIVNYNSGEYLSRCLQSLHNQTNSSDQIIVVDNASSDGSMREIERRFPDVKTVRLSTNVGFAAANNIAIRQIGNADWIALINADAFAEPQWLEELLDAAARRPEFDVLACAMLRDDNPTQSDGNGDVYHVSGFAWRAHCGLPASESPLDEREVFGACAAAVCYRREALVACGGFDERFFCYFEDVDLAFRLRLAGHRCLLVPRAVVRHVGSAVSGRRSDFTVYHAQRNLEWTWFKNMPTPLLWWYLPQHLLLGLVTVIWFMLRGQSRVICRSKWDALMALPTIWRQRQHIQSTRQVRVAAIRRQMARGWFAPYLRSRK